MFAGLLWLCWKFTICTLVVLPLCLWPLLVLDKQARRAMKSTLTAWRFVRLYCKARGWAGRERELASAMLAITQGKIERRRKQKAG